MADHEPGSAENEMRISASPVLTNLKLMLAYCSQMRALAITWLCCLALPSRNRQRSSLAFSHFLMAMRAMRAGWMTPGPAINGAMVRAMDCACSSVTRSAAALAGWYSSGMIRSKHVLRASRVGCFLELAPLAIAVPPSTTQDGDQCAQNARPLVSSARALRLLTVLDDRAVGQWTGLLSRRTRQLLLVEAERQKIWPTAVGGERRPLPSTIQRRTAVLRGRN